MNQLQRNFRTVIESWVSIWRLHRRGAADRREIRRHGRQLREARKTADEMHKATGKTYYCLPDHENNMRVLDKMGIKGLKRVKVMSKDVTVVDLLTESEYNTMNNHFVVLFSTGYWEFFRGTIVECIEKYKPPIGPNEIQILGGFERIVTIKDGKIIKH